VTTSGKRQSILQLPPRRDAADVRRWSPIEAHVAAVAVTAAIYVIIFGLAAGMAVHFGGSHWIGSLIPNRPLLIVGSALLLAQCSLIAIWWTRSNWPSHAKTLLAALGWFWAWAMLIALLPATVAQSAAGGGWAICLAIQTTIVTAVILTIRDGAGWWRVERWGRYSLLSLLLWMTLIATLLGGGRSLAIRLGWTEEVFRWGYFRQVRTIGEVNAVLAVAVFFVVNTPRRTWLKIILGVLAAATIAWAAPLVMSWEFNDVGATQLDLAWLFGAQGVFVLATLIPLEMAHDSASK
jgi:hypothetical protein